MNKRTKLLVAGLAILAMPFLATFVYLRVIRDDAPPRLTVADVTTTAATTAASAPGASDAAPAGIEGTWTVGEGSVVAYRVSETLFGQSAEAQGRSEGVTGTLQVADTRVTAAELTVDMATFSSDESRRDGQFNGRIMAVDQFPTATFTLTTPIELGAEPEDGTKVSVEAVGDLTLHGVTRSVTFPLTVLRSGSTVAVDGSLDITFADYAIDNPSGGPAQVGDSGALEVLLVLGR